MIALLLAACLAPTLPDERPVASPTDGAGKSAEPPPARPEPPAEPVLPPLPEPDPRVVRIFRDADTFMPADLNDAVEATRHIDDPIPSLLALVLDTQQTNRIFALCHTIRRLEIRDERVPTHLAPLLRSDDVLTVSTCGQAVAASLPEGSRQLGLVWSIISDENARCTTRQNLAAALDEPSVCGALFEMTMNPGCSQEVGVTGLHSCPGAQERMVALAADEGTDLGVRVAALAALRHMEPHAPGRETYLWWAEHGDELKSPKVANNGAAFALELMAGVGTPEDVPKLEAIAQNAPFGREDVRAVNARAAIRAIRSRTP